MSSVTATSKRTRSPEERRRLFEVMAMVVTTVVLLGLSRLERNLFGLSERLSAHRDFITSVVYFGLINLNVVLILVLSFLIFRNIIKLVVERRRGVIGSRLRTKLVVTLVFFAVAPTALLFYVSTRFLTESFDTWFSTKVESTIHKTREAGALVYKRDKRRLESLARIALQRIDVETPEPFFMGTLPMMDPRRLDGFESEYRLDSVKVFDRNGHLVWKSGGVTAEDQADASEDAFVLTAIDRFIRNPGMTSRGTVEVEEGRDVVKGVAPVYSSSGTLVGVVTTEERFETQIVNSVEAILREFAELKPAAEMISLSYMILLIMMVLIIIFSATWLGFYVAKGIIGPIQSLGEATREVALGNYDITLTAKTDDETGQLVRSFNRMTRDLKNHELQVKNFTAELEKTNDELERRRKYMEVVLRNISTGVISIDAAGLLTSVNRAAERLLGVSASSTLGTPVREGLGERLWETFWKPIAERMQSSSSFNGEIELNETGRQLTLLADASRIYDENDVDFGLVVVFDDASEQVKVQRVAAWREVARRIAHEIKNPITPIKLSAQRLLRRFGDQFQGNDRNVFESCIETIVSEVDSLRDLVNEFSKFSRLPSIKAKPEDLNDLILDVTSLYSMSYSHISFDTSGLQGDLPLVPLDREQMNRVFVNLITNAIAAIPESEPKGRVELRSMLLEGYNTVRVEVVDNGIGIPAKLRDRVLEPYFSTKAEGTGLGLAIVNQVVTEHGGYLRVTDNYPRGTTMIIELPLGQVPSDVASKRTGRGDANG